MIKFTQSIKKAVLDSEDKAVAVQEDTLKLVKFKLDVIKKVMNIDYLRGYTDAEGLWHMTDDKLLSLEIKGSLYDDITSTVKAGNIITAIEGFIVNRALLKHLGTLNTL